MSILVDRTVDATDGTGGVTSGVFRLGVRNYHHFGFSWTTTGGPATLNARASVETSMDGINWSQMARFTDGTATGGGKRTARIHSSALADELDPGGPSDLDSAAVSGVLNDVAGYYVRAKTKLQTLTGGTAPTVRFLVTSLD